VYSKPLLIQRSNLNLEKIHSYKPMPRGMV
jgi:hypothetical protein